MKHGLFYTIGIIVLSMVSVTTSPAQVVMQPLPIGVPSASGPYYVTPSWDQKLPSASRFIILSDWDNAAILDKETGLVWQRSPSTIAVTWVQASNYCTNLVVSNRFAWHLPTIQELGSLVDRSVTSSPKLPSGHPFMNVRSSYYWSATTSASISSSAWVEEFTYGGGVPVDKLNSSFVWCVRGGNGVDAQ
jgi:hypothetical protein